jgi:hypothetical protein
MDPAVLERLRDVPLREYAVAALKIVNKDGELVALDFDGRPGQIKLADAIEQQKAQGLPVRIVLVKSRQFGGSTAVQGEMQKRGGTTARRKVLTVAHRLDTAESLFAMGLTMWENLPDGMKPPMGGFNNPTRGTKIMWLGEKVGGIVSGWPNSKFMIDTAEEVEAGRGLTYTDLHLTEVAYWRDSRKALGLLSAVPDRPGTSIFLESTANGQNWFYDRAKAAATGASEYELVFVGFHEDPDCWRAFRTAEEREEFVASIGRPEKLGDLAPIAEDEDWLVEEFGCTPEQLHFRRVAIVDKCEGKVELFRQEYPATWQEAFVGSGRQVFSVVFTQRAIREAENWSQKPPEDGGPQRGLFVGTDPVTRKLTDGEIEVPSKVIWTPEAELTPRTMWWPGRYYEPKTPLWTLWMPKERSAEEWRRAQERGEVGLGEMEAGIEQAARGPRQYLIGGDAAGDTFNDVASQMEENAWNTLVGIDHWTGVQVAEFRAKIDHDLMAYHAFLAGTFLNEAWVSIERTGGYGGIILDVLQRRLYYRRLYTEKVLDDKKKREINRLGWDTNRRTKPQMEANAQALLREGEHGIRSVLLAGELPTFLKDDKNPAKHGPAPGSFSDLLMAWCQVQMIKLLKPPRPAAPKDGHRPNSMVRGRIRR